MVVTEGDKEGVVVEDGLADDVEKELGAGLEHPSPPIVCWKYEATPLPLLLVTYCTPGATIEWAFVEVHGKLGLRDICLDRTLSFLITSAKGQEQASYSFLLQLKSCR